MKVMSTPFFVILVALSWAVLKLQKGKSEEPSWTMEAVLIGFRDLSEISRGGGEVENRGGLQSFEPFKREGYEKKMRGKEEGLQKNKPHRSSRDASLLCFTRIQTTYNENHDMQLFPDIQFNLQATVTFWSSQREFCLLLPLSQALSAWYTCFGFISRIRWRDRSWRPPCGPVTLLPFSVCFKIKWCFCKRLLPI